MGTCSTNLFVKENGYINDTVMENDKISTICFKMQDSKTLQKYLGLIFF